MSERNNSAGVITVPPRTIRSRSAMMLARQRLQEVVQDGNGHAHIVRLHRFGGMMADALFAAHEKHGDRRDRGQCHRVVTSPAGELGGIRLMLPGCICQKVRERGVTMDGGGAL